MRLAAFGCALAVVALGLPVVGVAQTSSPQPAPIAVPFDGPTPIAEATPCPGETSALPSIEAPAAIAISPESRANFNAFNHDGHGSFIITMRQDGQHSTIVTPTADIDAALRAELLAFGRRVTMKNPLPGCPRWAGLIVGVFNPSDGAVGLTVVPPPPKKAMPTSFSAEDYQKADARLHPDRAVPIFVGPTPDARGTACPGESDPRGVFTPRNIGDIPPDSATFFLAHNSSPQLAFVMTLRLDGHAAISIPNQLVVDDMLRAAVVAYAQRIGLRPPIEGCARPAGIFIGFVAIPSGAVTLRQMPPKK
jgi:hypothetical protein